MEIEGKIIIDLPLQSGTSKAGNPWKKKEWVLETFGNYPKKVKFHVFGDRVDTMRLEVGKNYTISFDLESREFNGRWYTDVSAYAARDYVPEGYAPQQPQTGFAPQQPFPQPQMGGFGAPAPQGGSDFGAIPDNGGDDLPF